MEIGGGGKGTATVLCTVVFDGSMYLKDGGRGLSRDRRGRARTRGASRLKETRGVSELRGWEAEKTYWR